MNSKVIYGPLMRIRLHLQPELLLRKPSASEVLTCHIKQRKYPPWTSYFIKYSSIVNDQFSLSYFNWQVGQANYHILRTGCFPYIKYHCTKASFQNLDYENKFFLVLKILNIGLPTMAYGLGATFLIKHEEIVHTCKG
ncbi:hypothetical protein X975_04755, partial [Stegodyphus mimosarum]